jgi:hypothetical protein
MTNYELNRILFNVSSGKVGTPAPSPSERLKNASNLFFPFDFVNDRIVRRRFERRLQARAPAFRLKNSYPELTLFNL